MEEGERRARWDQVQSFSGLVLCYLFSGLVASFLLLPSTHPPRSMCTPMSLCSSILRLLAGKMGQAFLGWRILLSWRPIIMRRGWLLLCGLFLTSSPPSLSGTACQSIRQPASKWEVTLHVLGTGLGAISCCRNLLFSPCLVTTFLCLWHDSAPFFTCVVFCWWVLAVIFDRFVLWFAHCS